MKKILLLIFPVLLLVFVSCSSNEDTTENKTVISTQLIGKGDLIGNSLPQQNLVITTSAEWTTLLAQLDSQNNVSAGFTETNINFNQFMVLAVFDETYGNGGHSIDIISVDEQPQNIVVDVDKLLTGDVTTVVTQPYHIVKIQKSTKPVIFQ